jgi:phosphatidate cytidylyltransferase
VSDEEDFEGLRILGSDPDAEAAGDDELPHWAEAPDESGSWASSDPKWDDSWDEETDTHAVGGGSAGGAGEFNPSLLPPEDDYELYDPAEATGRTAYTEDPDQFGAMPAIGIDSGSAPAAAPAPSAPSTGRDLPVAVGVAVGMAAIALICFSLGKRPTLMLVAVVLAAAAVEWFYNLRQRGYQPATLLGIAACGTMPLAVYWRGTEAFPLVLFLTIVVGALWYLTGVATERPVPNLGVTLYGVVYIGMLGSFAALMLKAPNGIGMLLAAIIVTAAYDIGGYFIGSTMGRSSFSSASPNKTVEGLLGGGVVAIIAAVVVLNIVGLTPFGSTPGGFVEAFSLGVAAAIFAPLGDLTESMLKRDLDVKDMGSLLPGHGGLLDRFDALLIMLPVTYYMARLFDLY